VPDRALPEGDPGWAGPLIHSIAKQLLEAFFCMYQHPNHMLVVSTLSSARHQRSNPNIYELCFLFYELEQIPKLNKYLNKFQNGEKLDLSKFQNQIKI
jgi:hypothetical protein